MRAMALALLLTACFGKDTGDEPEPPGPRDRGEEQGGDGGDQGGTLDSDGGTGTPGEVDPGGDGGTETGDGGTETGDGGSSGDGGTAGDGGTTADCPEDVTCITTFPTTVSGSTVGADSDDFDAYACSPTTNESGPEVLYRVTVPEEGFLALSLDEGDMEGDIDIHLLESRDPDDCVDRGHWRAGALVPAGEYWVVADTWVSSSGAEYTSDYTLTFGLTTVDDLAAAGMSRTVAADALHAYDVAWADDDASHFAYAVTDFSLHAGEARQWVLDMGQGSVEWQLYVAHGDGSASRSDPGLATSFSNTPDSHQSSLGMMQAAETYTGTYGYSMRLDGLEAGYNDNVRDRYIVVHPWQGSREEYVDDWGAAANTWGCPAIDDRLSEDVIDFLADGGLLFFHYPDGDWSEHSAYLP